MYEDGQTDAFNGGSERVESEMHSNNSSEDLELIAALIDGRLAGEDRARAMKLLADSDEALELYSQAVRERYGTLDSKVVPIAARRGWRQWKLVIPIVAAAGLAIVAVPVLRNRGTSPASAREYAMELGRDRRFASALSTGWEQRAWPVTRGAGTGEQPGAGPVDSVLAFRLGVRSLDLQVALDRGDTALAGRMSADIVDMLNSVPLSASVADRYTDLRSHLATDTRDQAVDRASDAERRLRERLGSPSFALGQWVAAAELAARTRDVSFFQSARVTRSVESIGGISMEAREMIRSVDAGMKQASTDRAFEDAEATLQRIIQRSGG